MPAIPHPKAHFPHLTKTIIQLLQSGSLPQISTWYIEPEYGFFTHLTYTTGETRVTYRNNPGINTASAAMSAKDKGVTKTLLRMGGFSCPDGKEFLLPWWRASLGLSESYTLDDCTREITDYLTAQWGFPAYLKPIDGSQGRGVTLVHTAEELRAVLTQYQDERIRLAVVERPVAMPDYRIVIYNDRLISAYQRVPLQVTGDGIHTIRELLAEKQADFTRAGRDTQLPKHHDVIARYGNQQGYTLETVLPDGQIQQLLPVSNLSMGGTSVDVTATIHPHWVELAKAATRHGGLTLCGVDLACPDITVKGREYAILELNAAPGLDHYATSGEAQATLVLELYTELLREPPH